MLGIEGCHVGLDLRSHAASPLCRATIRRRFQQARPQPGVFKGASEEDVVAQAEAAIDRILAGEPPEAA